MLYTAAYIYISANKKKIISELTATLSDKIRGDVHIGDADVTLFGSFPGLSVLMKDVSITDTMYAVHHHAFFAAKEMFVKISIYKLITRESPLSGLKIRNGNIFMFTDTSGYTNMYLLKSKKDSAGGPKRTSADINLQNITLEHMHIVLQDLKREKLHDMLINDLDIDLDDDGSNLDMDADADIVINSLAFNLPRGTFLKGATFRGEFNLKYGKQSQQLSFEDIPIRLSGQKFALTGAFDLGDKNPAFSLKVKVRQANYEAIKKLLPHRIDSSLSMVALDKPLDADAELYGPLRGGEPFILVSWKVMHSKLATQFLDFDDASFTGFYKNEVTKGLPRKDPNSVLVVRGLTASWHGLPATADRIQILNLAVPELTCDLRSAFPLASLNELLQANSMQMTSGNALVQLNYRGPVQRNDNTNSFLNGNVQFTSGTMMYTRRNVQMTEMNGYLRFSNSNINIDNLHCKVLGSSVTLNGTANNILTLISTQLNQVKIDFSIYSPSLNLGSFTYLLQSPKKVTVAKSSKNQFGKLAGQIDDLLEQSRINVALKADAVSYKKFHGTGLAADVSLLQDRYLLNNVTVNVAGGRMGLNGELVSVRNNYHQASLKVNMQNVDVKQVFYAFDNFGQDGITSQSLEGKLTTDANVSIGINDAGAVLPSSANGVVNFSLKNGALNDYEPIKKVQTFIFKKRDFENIRFAELKDRFDITNGEIKINRMEIQSSVLSLYVEGIYSQKGNTDISIQVPLSNLKKRGDDYNPENVGADKKGGRSLYVRGRPGDDGSIKFKLDLFNKFKKDNN